MDLQEQWDGSMLVLEPVGHLVKSTSPEFQSRVVELVDEGARHIVVDLTKTEHIGGAGLRVLLMLSKKLDSMDGGLVLCSMRQEVRKAFDLAGFTRLFSITSSRDRAVRELSGDETVARVSDLAADLLAASEERDTSSKS